MSCLTEQTLSLLTLPGHRAVDDASVLFHPTPSHRFRQDQALPSCVCSQSLLSGSGKQSVVLQGPPPCPSYRAGSGLVHWEDPEGLGREGGGRGDRDGEYM